MRGLLLTSVVLTVFLMGWTASALYRNYDTLADLETPFSFRSLFSIAAPELQSPGDHIPEDSIRVYDDRMVVQLDGISWAKYADTNSMDPVFDSTANGIEISPKSPDDITSGDIISYRTFGDGLVVYRVIETGTDDEGWFAVTRGDNNPSADPRKVRFADIHGVLVGILY